MTISSRRSKMQAKTKKASWKCLIAGPTSCSLLGALTQSHTSQAIKAHKRQFTPRAELYELLFLYRFPMAGPSGAILQGTRRGSRYWALRGQMQQAIAAASGRPPAPTAKDVEAPEAVGILEASTSLPLLLMSGPGRPNNLPSLSSYIWKSPALPFCTVSFIWMSKWQ